MNVSLVSTPVSRQTSATRFTQPQDSGSNHLPQESLQLSGNQGMSVSTKNAIVSAVGGLGAGMLTLSGMVPGGSIGNWIAGVAVFALVKGVHHGFEEVAANKKNGSPYDDGACFKLGFSEYGKRNVLNGFIHSSINGGLAAFGGFPGALAGAGISAALTKMTGY